MPSRRGMLAFADPLARHYCIVASSVHTLGPANSYAKEILTDGPNHFTTLMTPPAAPPMTLEVQAASVPSRRASST